MPTNIAHSIVCQHSEHTVYNEEGLSAIEACTPEAGTLLQRQYLFSVYVHSSRLEGFSDFSPDSPFYGTLLPETHEASWGDTTPATRQLLRAALKDPLNVNFLLLSDSDIPLYPATLVYQQLVHEKKSRVAACWPYDMVNIKRYSCAMEAEGLGMDKWRKNTLWFTMQRGLAELASVEEFVYGIFRRHCTNVGFDASIQDFRGCLTDEHYYGTLFSYYNRAQETDCLGVVTHADFRNSVAGHPKKYIAEEVNLELLEELRTPIWWLPKASCAKAVTQEARNAFVSLKQLQLGIHHDHCNRVDMKSMLSLMETHCQLFARKFHGNTSAPLLDIFTNASNTHLVFDLKKNPDPDVLGSNELLTRVHT